MERKSHLLLNLIVFKQHSQDHKFCTGSHQGAANSTTDLMSGNLSLMAAWIPMPIGAGPLNWT